MSRNYLVLSVSVAVIMILASLGCNGASSAVSPNSGITPMVGNTSQVTGNHSTGETGRSLLAYGLAYIDPANMTYETVPMRTPQGHLNIISWLENSPCSSCFQISKMSKGTNGNLLVDIKIRHPFTAKSMTGFDARAIAMFNGSKSFPSSGLTMSDRTLGNAVLANADGYTTLYNPTTVGSGPNGVQGYMKGKLAMGSAPNALLNGYIRYSSSDAANTRNAFYAGDTITKTFQIDKPAGPIVFGYAADASWAPPITKPVTNPMTDFGPDANSPDAWKIAVTENAISGGLIDAGGQTKLSIDVYSVYPSQFMVSLEAPELLNSVLSTDTVVSTGAGYNRYEIIVDNLKLATAGDYKSLISVVNKSNPASPDWMDLTAYQVYSLKVLASQPTPPVAKAKASPNPQTEGVAVHFSDDGSYDPDGGNIAIYEWDWDNNGTFDATGASADHSWATAGTYYVQFRVTDDESQTATLASPMQITINVNKVPPVALASANPNPQDAGVAVHFSDNGSNDPDGGSITKYEWDWNNDGTYDQTGASLDHTWATAGTYYVQFRVTDDDSQTATLAAPLQITINPVVTKITWNADIGPILAANCSPCHITSSTSGVHLDTYAHAMASNVIKVGNPTGSKIYTKISGGNHYGKLTSPELSKLYDWILNGAPES
jgi:hypothetical protein